MNKETLQKVRQSRAVRYIKRNGLWWVLGAAGLTWGLTGAPAALNEYNAGKFKIGSSTPTPAQDNKPKPNVSRVDVISPGPAITPTQIPEVATPTQKVYRYSQSMEERIVSDTNFYIHENIKPEFLKAPVFQTEMIIVGMDAKFKTAVLVGLNQKTKISVQNDYNFDRSHIVTISGTLPKNLLPGSGLKDRGKAFFLESSMMDWTDTLYGNVESCAITPEESGYVERLLWISPEGDYRLNIQNNPSVFSCMT